MLPYIEDQNMSRAAILHDLPSEPSIVLNGQQDPSNNMNNPFLHVSHKNSNKLPPIANTKKPLNQRQTEIIVDNHQHTNAQLKKKVEKQVIQNDAERARSDAGRRQMSPDEDSQHYQK